MAETLSVSEMLPNKFEPKRQYRWVFAIEGIDSFLMKTAARPQFSFQELRMPFINSIRYLIENMPSSDSRHLRLAYKVTAPNIDLTQNFECRECSHEQAMEVPLNADFFWPDR